MPGVFDDHRRADGAIFDYFFHKVKLERAGVACNIPFMDSDVLFIGVGDYPATPGLSMNMAGPMTIAIV
jgi:hypothetical protein